MFVATVTDAETAGLRDDLGLTGVLLGVEHLVGDAALLERAAERLGLLHRHRADEHRLAGLDALGDVVDDGVELAVLVLEDEVALVVADDRHVRGDGHHLELVGAHELGGLGDRGAGHPRQLVVHAEVVLEGDRREGLVLLLDPHALLRLDRLVQTVGPTAAVEDAAGELVDDLHLAVLHQVVLVALVQLLGLERSGELVHEVRRHLVVHVLDAEGLLDLLDARSRAG